MGEVNYHPLITFFLLIFCAGAAFAVSSAGEGAADANSADANAAVSNGAVAADIAPLQGADVDAGHDANDTAVQQLQITASADQNASPDANSTADLNAVANADVNSAGTDLNAAGSNGLADLNVSLLDTNASDSNAGHIDVNAADLNANTGTNPNPDINADATDLNAGALDLNAGPGLNVSLDLNLSLDLNAQKDQNAIDANAILPLQFTIPDFNFFRALGDGSGAYLSTFNSGFLGKIKGFIDSIFDGISAGWAQGPPDTNGTAHGLDGLYTVPDLNYLSATDSNSPPAFGFLSGVKAALDSFLERLAQGQPEAPKTIEPIDVNVNGVAAKCFGDCGNIPAVVK